MTAHVPAGPRSRASRPGRRRRRLSAGKKAAFALATLAGLVGLAEGACRARAWLRARGRAEGVPFAPDASRGVVLRPGVHEVAGRVATINALGMREREVGPERAAGVRRVLCVGASSTYGLFIERDELTWPARLEGALRAGGHEVEVLNAGTPSWDVRASQTNLELRLFALRPDIMIVCHTYNDVLGNLDPGYAADSRVEDVGALWRPQRHSALFGWLTHKLARPDLALARKASAATPDGARAFARNLRRMVRRGREQGAAVVLTTEPMACRPTLAASLRAGVPQVESWFGRLSPFTYEATYTAMRTYYDVVRAVARETGAPLIDLAAHMPDDVRLFRSPIHHSPAGSDVVAGLVARGLWEARLLTPAQHRPRPGSASTARAAAAR